MSLTVRSFVIGLLSVALPTASCAKKEEKKAVEIPVEPYDLVNTFIGSEPILDPSIIGFTPPVGWRVWAGLTFPGAALPHGMVQLSPVTTFVTGAGYFYEDTIINGFTHTNKGHWNLCNISVMPVVTRLYIEGSGDRLGPWHEKGYGSHFSHDREKASPGYYSVFLDDYKTNVELTVTRRTGFHRWTFPASKNSYILIDMKKANSKVEDAFVELVDRSTVRGWQKTGEGTIFFYMTFDRQFEKCGYWDGWRSAEMKDKPLSASGPETGAYIMYETKDNDVVQAKIGLSFVGMDNARMNLERENPGWDFEAVRADAKETWRNLLSTIETEGGTHKQRVMFYSSLYRLCLWPALRSDVDGSFTGENGKVDHADYDYYTIPSLWDTFRNKLTLLTLIEPEVARDINRSITDMGTKTGWMPTFFFGDHAASMITGAYLRGIRDFDVEEAYRLMCKNATQSGGTRGDMSEYIAKGYVSTVPVEKADIPPIPGSAGTMRTIEYAYDDYSIALLAKELGKTDDYNLFMERAKNYRNVFDPATRFMRGKTKDGAWVEPFNPEFPYYEYMYREANAWQSTFFAPHDVPGLVELFGGKEPFIAKLDSLFTVPWNPDYIARNVCCMIGQYSHGNQPDHHAPYLYDYVGEPWKTQRMVRRIMDSLYGIGEKGLALPGMDDAGEMSSWYVFGALGFYPVAPSTKIYALGSPIFSKAVIHLPKYIYNNATFTITAKNASPENIYIKSFAIDGEASTKTWLSHDDIAAGKTISFVMGAEPDTAWGTSEGDAPPVVK